MNTAVEELFIDHTALMMREAQFRLTGPYIDRVIKFNWPAAKECVIPVKDSHGRPTIEGFGCEERAYSLKKSAIQSEHICLEDFRLQEQVTDTIFNVQRTFIQGLEHIWDRTFRRDIIKTITTRSIACVAPKWPDAGDPLPRKVNFFGKEVSPYAHIPGTTGVQWMINPKYRRAATQYVEFHPDIVHFLFPDPENWAGEMKWINIPDREHNPDGTVGFFRVLLTYAAKPIRPDLGRVVTVPPPGLRGLLWFWAWKLVGFVP